MKSTYIHVKGCYGVHIYMDKAIEEYIYPRNRVLRNTTLFYTWIKIFEDNKCPCIKILKSEKYPSMKILTNKVQVNMNKDSEE